MTPPRKLHIKSYGCQMNVYDAQRMVDTLRAEGFVETSSADDADLVILNTCHIREKASEKVYSELGRLRVARDAAALQGRDVKIAVAGCVAQAEGEEIIRRAPVVDLVVGPQSYHHLPQLLERAARGEKAIETEFPAEDKFGFLPQPKADAIRARGISAFVTVQEGCDKFCTFCVVPYTRGAEVSRPVEKIIDDVKRLAENGVRELTLIGQNVNAYHGEGPDGKSWPLGKLLHRLAAIPGIARLRYSTSHPRDVDDSLIEAHRDLPVLMPFVHLPVQSGSDRILSAMNRKHTVKDYLDVIERFRRARQDIAFSSDFIVGFPGENEQDFSATLALVMQIGYAAAYSFKYSPRPGTPAAEMRETVSAADMDERLARLQELIDSQQSAFNKAAIGATVDVLFERLARNPGQIVGRTAYLQPAHVMASPDIIGQVLPVKIESLERYSLKGELAQATAQHLIDLETDQHWSLKPLPKSASDLPSLVPSRKFDRDMQVPPETQVVIDFDDNRAVSSLVGPYGQNLAQIERRLGIVVDFRGNHITIAGSRDGCDAARRVLEALYAQAAQGHDLAQGDVEGAIRAVIAQGSLFEYDAKSAKSAFESINLRKRPVRARTAAQDSYIRALKRHELVFGVGPAGTGKTWLAVAHAAQLFERKEVDRIILTRPAVEAGERLGFLPGDLKDKVDPYLRPIYDALYDLMDARIVERALQTGEIEIAPLAFMRGRTLTNAAIILDEAQNTTTMQMKMFLTRLGENSRMIVTGDPSQVDLPHGQASGLAEATRLLDGVEGIAQVKFTAEDVIRHELVARIVAAYEAAPRKPVGEK